MNLDISLQDIEPACDNVELKVVDMNNDFRGKIRLSFKAKEVQKELRPFPQLGVNPLIRSVQARSLSPVTGPPKEVPSSLIASPRKPTFGTQFPSPITAPGLRHPEPVNQGLVPVPQPGLPRISEACSGSLAQVPNPLMQNPNHEGNRAKPTELEEEDDLVVIEPQTSATSKTPQLNGNLPVNTLLIPNQANPEPSQSGGVNASIANPVPSVATLNNHFPSPPDLSLAGASATPEQVNVNDTAAALKILGLTFPPPTLSAAPNVSASNMSLSERNVITSVTMSNRHFSSPVAAQSSPLIRSGPLIPPAPVAAKQPSTIVQNRLHLPFDFSSRKVNSQEPEFPIQNNQLVNGTMSANVEARSGPYFPDRSGGNQALDLSVNPGYQFALQPQNHNFVEPVQMSNEVAQHHLLNFARNMNSRSEHLGTYTPQRPTNAGVYQQPQREMRNEVFQRSTAKTPRLDFNNNHSNLAYSEERPLVQKVLPVQNVIRSPVMRPAHQFTPPRQNHFLGQRIKSQQFRVPVERARGK